MWYTKRRKIEYAPLAQMDRAQASDAWCRRFESAMVRQKKGLAICKSFFQRNLPIWASEIASLWNICSANVKYSLTRTWANFISHRTKWDISQCALAHYFTFCLAKHFTYIYHPTIRFYKCNTLYLAGQDVWKGVLTKTSVLLFSFSEGKTYCKVGRPTKFAHLGKWNRFAVKYLLRKRGQISFHIEWREIFHNVR